MEGKRSNRRFWSLAVFGLVSILIVPAVAQEGAPQQKPAPAQKPAAQPTPIYSPWTKLCAPESQGATPTCLTLTEARAQTGQFLAGAGLIEQEGVEKKTVRITLPLAMLNQKGIQITFDQDQPMPGPYLTCLPAGCLADYDATPAIVEKMKKDQTLLVKAIRLDGSLLAVPIPLAGFGKANAGPPTDPKVLAERQQKLREQMQGGQEGGQQAPAAKQPAAPAPAQ
jgi:invasion protein IalB